MKLIIKVVILVVSALWVTVASSGELSPVGLQKQLLVDDYVIAQKHNITCELGRPEKLGVVMKAPFMKPPS